MAANAIPAMAVTAMAMPTLEPPPPPRPPALALAKEIHVTMRQPPKPADGWCIKNEAIWWLWWRRRRGEVVSLGVREEVEVVVLRPWILGLIK